VKSGEGPREYIEGFRERGEIGVLEGKRSNILDKYEFVGKGDRKNIARYSQGNGER